MKLVSINDLMEKFAVNNETIKRFKRKGMPFVIPKRKKGQKGYVSHLFDEELCGAWIAANSKIGVKLPSEQVLAAAADAIGNEESLTLPVSGTEVLGTLTEEEKKNISQIKEISSAQGMKWSIERIRLAEVQAFQMLLSAHKIHAKNPMVIQVRLRLYTDTMKALSAMETCRDVRKEQEREIQSEFCEALKEWLEPIKSLLDTAPKSLAVKCNPDMPSHAEEALANWLQNSLLPMMSRNFSKEAS